MNKPTYWDHNGPHEMPEITQYRCVEEAMCLATAKGVKSPSTKAIPHKVIGG